MPPNDEHQWLVEQLIDYWGRQGLALDGLRVDGSLGTGNCPVINGHRPDLFVRDRASFVATIGEAKTCGDVVNPHTEGQLAAYFKFLSQGEGQLYLAVPWKRLDHMYFFARRCRRIARADDVRFVVLGVVRPAVLVRVLKG